MKTPIGIDKDSGDIRYIEDVEKGLACNCVCCGCGAPLIAKKGDKVTHHFSHYQSAENESCGETALHLLGKAVIMKSNVFKLPVVQFDIIPSLLSSTNRLILGKSAIELGNINLKDHEEEVYMGEYQPDVLCTFDWENETLPLAFEIAVTHKVEDEKSRNVKNDDLSMIEIDLAYLLKEKILTWEMCAQAVHDQQNQKWIHLSRKITDSASKLSFSEMNSELQATETQDQRYKEQALNWFVGKEYAELPEYPYEQAFNTELNQSEIAGLARYFIKSAPVLKASWPLKSAELRGDHLMLVLTINDREISLPVYFREPQTDRPTTHLRMDLSNGDAYNYEALMAWGYSTKAENFIIEKRQALSKANQKKACANQSTSQKIDSFIRSGKGPMSENLGVLQADTIASVKECDGKGFNISQLLMSVHEPCIFGCGYKIWQVAILNIIFNSEKDSVKIDEMLDEMASIKGIKVLDVYRNYFFSLKGSKDKGQIRNSFKLLSDYFAFLLNKGILEKRNWNTYSKCCAHGRGYWVL